VSRRTIVTRGGFWIEQGSLGAITFGGVAPLKVTFVAHAIHEDGGMERVMANLVREVAPLCDVTVVSRVLAPELRRQVRWERVRVPRRPAVLTSACFFVRAGIRLRSVSSDLVHTMGAIVPNRADVA